MSGRPRTMQTRLATAQDEALLRELAQACAAGMELSAAQQKRLASVPAGTSFCQVQEVSGALVSVVAAYDLGGGAWELGVLATVPAWRKHGIGRMLLEMLEDRARALGVRSITFTGPQDTDAWDHFLRTLGYKRAENRSAEGHPVWHRPLTA